MTTNNGINNTLSNATATSLTFSPTTSGIVGTTTNDNASAGTVGEFFSSIVTAGSGGFALTNSTAANMTSISLTAGDWDVWGNASFTFSIGSANSIVWVSSTSATLAGVEFEASFGVNHTGCGMAAPPRRFSLSTTTTIYISGYAVFGAGSGTMYGGIYARRVR